IPRLLRVLVEAGNRNFVATFYGLPREFRQDPAAAEAGVAHVPTVIVRLARREIGRIEGEPRIAHQQSPSALPPKTPVPRAPGPPRGAAGGRPRRRADAPPRRCQPRTRSKRRIPGSDAPVVGTNPHFRRTPIEPSSSGSVSAITRRTSGRENARSMSARAVS